jgi:hypothetical protein
MRVIILAASALFLIAAMGPPGPYAVECWPGSCEAADHSMQLPGTFVRGPIEAQVDEATGKSPWTSPGPSFHGTYRLVPWKGQKLYAPPPGQKSAW